MTPTDVHIWRYERVTNVILAQVLNIEQGEDWPFVILRSPFHNILHAKWDFVSELHGAVHKLYEF